MTRIFSIFSVAAVLLAALVAPLTVRESARVDGEISEKDLIHWTFLLPAMIQLP